MKTWTDDNPKAKLLKRKQEAILAAAKRQFLAHGYGGASMEAVAAAAGVSIMTLYRHAESKDELFEAVIAIECSSGDDAAEHDVSGMALTDILVGTALGFQQKLNGEETMALLRAVIAEHGRFPQLAGVAYRAIVGHLSQVIDLFVANAPETRGIDATRRAELCARFADDLFGADTLRVLLGLEGKTAAEQQTRAERATAAFLAELG